MSSRSTPSFFSRLRAGLGKTAQKFSSGFAQLVGGQKLDLATLESFEEFLISADFGPHTAKTYCQALAKEFLGKNPTTQELEASLKALMRQTLASCPVWSSIPLPQHPTVILMVGVNGTGKTTMIGKLADSLRAQGKRVLLVAGDTFRAAAIAQLNVWAERAGVDFFAKSSGADPAGLAFDAFQKAKKEGYDVVILDTAGRLHTRADLMASLPKIQRVLQKLDPTAPHHCWIVLDATTGQNALAQLTIFQKTIPLTGMLMSKLDSTAKGGMILSLVAQAKLPVIALGLGEQLTDWEFFDSERFIDGFFSESETAKSSASPDSAPID